MTTRRVGQTWQTDTEVHCPHCHELVDIAGYGYTLTTRAVWHQSCYEERTEQWTVLSPGF